MPSRPLSRNRRPSTDRKFFRILSAAAKVFSIKGFEKASIRMVASRARVSLAGIYYHVQSKDELLFLIQYNAFRSILSRLGERLDALQDAEPRERLRVLIRNHLDYFMNRIDELKGKSDADLQAVGTYLRKQPVVEAAAVSQAMAQHVKSRSGRHHQLYVILFNKRQLLASRLGNTVRARRKVALQVE